MRFSSPEEVKAAAEKFAAYLVRRHVEDGYDLNPYCTPGARHDFDKAFSGAPRSPWELSPEWDYRYQVGRAAARMITNTQN